MPTTVLVAIHIYSFGSHTPLYRKIYYPRIRKVSLEKLYELPVTELPNRAVGCNALQASQRHLTGCHQGKNQFIILVPSALGGSVHCILRQETWVQGLSCHLLSDLRVVCFFISCIGSKDTALRTGWLILPLPEHMVYTVGFTARPSAL